MELLAEKQAQLPKFQRKLYGPTTLEGVQTLVGNPNELCNFLLTQIPKDMVFQGEIFHGQAKGAQLQVSAGSGGDPRPK